MRRTMALLWIPVTAMMLVAWSVTYTSLFTREVMACPDHAGCGGDGRVVPLDAAYIPPQENPPSARVLYEYKCSAQHVAKCQSQACTNGFGTVGGVPFLSKKFVSDNVPYPRCVPTGQPKDKCYYFPQQCGTFYYFLFNNCVAQVYSKLGYLEKCA
jgi:hypothetical protein